MKGADPFERDHTIGGDREDPLRRWLEELFSAWGFSVAPGHSAAAATRSGRWADDVALEVTLPPRVPDAVGLCALVAPGPFLVAVRGDWGRRHSSEGPPLSLVNPVGHRDRPLDAEPVHLGDLEIDWRNLRVMQGGRSVVLSSQDLRLLCVLVRHRQQVLSRHELLELVWGVGYLGRSRMVDMAIRRLRERLEPDPASPRYIHTARGRGYYFACG